jgi:hypothetical protein
MEGGRHPHRLGGAVSKLLLLLLLVERYSGCSHRALPLGRTGTLLSW